MKKATIIALLSILIILAFVGGCSEDSSGDAFYVSSVTVDPSATVVRGTNGDTGMVATVDQTGTVLK